jgi:CRP-like cAMP-binding protein
MRTEIELIRDASGHPIATLPSFVAFGDWTRTEMAALRAFGRIERHAPRDVVIEPGPGDDRALFIVMAGEYEVHRDGQQRDVLRPGDLVGELAFVDGRPRTAAVRARTDGAMLRIRPDDVDRYAERDPKMALKFLLEIARILSFRLRTAWS